MAQVSLKSSIGKHFAEFSAFGDNPNFEIYSESIDVSKYLIHNFHFSVINDDPSSNAFVEVLVSNSDTDWSPIFTAEISKNSQEIFYFNEAFNFKSCKIYFKGSGSFSVFHSHNPVSRIASRSSGIPDQKKLPNNSNVNCWLCSDFNCGTSECPCACLGCNCETEPPIHDGGDDICTTHSPEDSLYISRTFSEDHIYKIYKSCSDSLAYSEDNIDIKFLKCESTSMQFEVYNDHDFSIYINYALNGYSAKHSDLPMMGPIPRKSKSTISIPLNKPEVLSFDFYYIKSDESIIFGSRIDVGHSTTDCNILKSYVYGSIHRNNEIISGANIFIYDSEHNLLKSTTSADSLIGFNITIDFESELNLYATIEHPEYLTFTSSNFSISNSGQSFFLEVPSMLKKDTSDFISSCKVFTKKYISDEFLYKDVSADDFRLEIQKECPFPFTVVSINEADRNNTKLLSSPDDKSITEKYASSFTYDVCYICHDNLSSLLSSNYSDCLPNNSILISSHKEGDKEAFKLTNIKKEGGTSCCDGIHEANTEVSIIATPDTNHVFDRWFGHGISDPNSANTTVLMSENKYIYPIFQPKDTLTFLSVLFTEGGSATGSGQFNKDSQVTVKATAKEGYNFDRWYIIEDIHDLSLSIQSSSNQNLEEKISNYLSEKDYLIQEPSALETQITMESHLTIVAKFVSNASQAAAAGDEYFSELSSEKINELKVSDELAQVGEVVYVDIEGGFYGITVEESKYFPVNIQKELAQYYEGPGITRVDFTGYSDPEYISFIMWGKPAFIEDYDIIIVEPEPIPTSTTEAEIIIDDPTSTTEAEIIIDDPTSTTEADIIIDDPTSTTEALTCEEPISINGYYPLFLTKDCSDEASIGGDSHTHVFDNTTYYMPTGGSREYGSNYHGNYVPPTTTTTEAPDIIEEHNSTYGATYKFVRFSNGLKVLLDPWDIDPSNNYGEFVGMFGSLSEPKCQQVSFNGRYPLYKWESCAKENSAPNTNPKSLSLDGKYGSETWYYYPGGATLYYGDWPHYPEDDSTTTTTEL